MLRAFGIGCRSNPSGLRQSTLRRRRQIPCCWRPGAVARKLLLLAVAEHLVGEALGGRLLLTPSSGSALGRSSRSEGCGGGDTRGVTGGGTGRGAGASGASSTSICGSRRLAAAVDGGAAWTLAIRVSTGAACAPAPRPWSMTSGVESPAVLALLASGAKAHQERGRRALDVRHHRLPQVEHHPGDRVRQRLETGPPAPGRPPRSRPRRFRRGGIEVGHASDHRGRGPREARHGRPVDGGDRRVLSGSRHCRR